MSMAGGDNLKSRAAYTREGRKQLFAVLQSARGSTGICLFKYGYTCGHYVSMYICATNVLVDIMFHCIFVQLNCLLNL